MKIRTVIIDDEPIALEKLRSYVAKVPFLELVGQFSSAVEATDCIINEPVDAVFTDISMPDLDGMKFIESLSCPPMVVFTTAYSQYAIDSYRLAAVDYLLKPYGFADFQRAANKLLQLYQGRAPRKADDVTRSLFVKTDYRYVRVDLSAIRYIKGYGEYLQLFVEGQASPLLTLSSFAAIRDKLTDSFVQIHRSYIVNMDRVERIEKSRVVMDAETWLPVSDSFRSDFLGYLSRHSAGGGS